MANTRSEALDDYHVSRVGKCGWVEGRRVDFVGREALELPCRRQATQQGKQLNSDRGFSIPSASLSLFATDCAFSGGPFTASTLFIW